MLRKEARDMPNATAVARGEKRIMFSELTDRIEEILRTNCREGARALLPELRILCGKLRRLRSMGVAFGGAGISKYVLAVATLAGRGDEFNEFA
jgi:hypothetical protein